MTFSRPGLRTVLVALAVIGCFAVTLAFAADFGSPALRAWLSGLTLSMAGAVAAVACLVRAQRITDDPRTRITWLLLGGGSLARGFGSTVQLVHEVALGGTLPTPSLADAGYLLSGALLAVGLLRMAVPEPNAAARIRPWSTV